MENQRKKRKLIITSLPLDCNYSNKNCVKRKKNIYTHTYNQVYLLLLYCLLLYIIQMRQIQGDHFPSYCSCMTLSSRHATLPMN